MEEQEQTPNKSNPLFDFGIAILVTITTSLMYGTALYYVWNWFIANSMHTQRISLAASCALGSLITFILPEQTLWTYSIAILRFGLVMGLLGLLHGITG